MFPGETILSGAPQICGPGNDLESSATLPSYLEDWDMHPKDSEGRPVTVDVLWDVYESGAGYYIGTFCPHCGPHTRESEYFSSKDTAEYNYVQYWMPYISDGKFDAEKYQNDDRAIPGERY